MGFIIGLGIGLFVGSFLAMITMSLMIASKQSDIRAGRDMEFEKNIEQLSSIVNN